MDHLLTMAIVGAVADVMAHEVPSSTFELGYLLANYSGIDCEFINQIKYRMYVHQREGKSSRLFLSFCA